jgi:hypothetical protein
MRFARTVFVIAGVWGLLVMTPMFFMFDLVGRQYPPPVTHPDIYFGFVSITWVWQIAFLILATDPVRYRPMMIAAMLEKFVFLAAMGGLYLQGRVTAIQLGIVSPDFVLGLLFIAAYFKTPPYQPMEQRARPVVQRRA